MPGLDEGAVAIWGINLLFYFRWLAGPCPTLRFHSISDALLYSRQEGLQKMEVVLLHSDSLHKLVLPAGAELKSEPEHSGYKLYRRAA